MSRDPRFLEAWVNRTDHRVFGRRLHPLCLLDLVALDAVDSPFLTAGAPADRFDFWMAAEILSRPIKSLDIDARIRRPGFWQMLRFRMFDLQRENERLRAYIDDFMSTLDMWRSADTVHRCHAPWALSQAVFLLHNTNLSEWRIWTAPVGQILCYAAALEEQMSDNSQVVSTEELEQMEALRDGQS